jgi:hypothetical protein
MAGEAVEVKGKLPVFVTITVSEALVPTATVSAKTTGFEGLTEAVVSPVLAVHSGVCQMPRP